MSITRTISLLKPAGFDLVAVCHHSRLREALFSSMSAPKRLEDVYYTQQLKETRKIDPSDTQKLVPKSLEQEPRHEVESDEESTVWDFALLMTYSFVLVFCTTVVLKVF